MVDKSKRFVYGTFHWPAEKIGKPTVRPHVPMTFSQEPNSWDPVAIEILREYGANELIGKLYFKGNFNQWIQMDPSRISKVDWYVWYDRLPEAARQAGTMYYFEMDGSGRWIVLHFRNESDETGPYVAVALRYSGTK